MRKRRLRSWSIVVIAILAGLIGLGHGGGGCRESDSDEHIRHEGGARGQSPAGRLGELSNVQLAFDSLIAEAEIVEVQPHLEASHTAKNRWTGFPNKSDGTAIRIDGVAADLTRYMPFGGSSGDETFYFYCWDADGAVFQHMISHPCP